MTLISIKKTAVVEPAPTGTVSLYVDSADSHLKQVDEAGAIIDLTDGSATSSPNMAQLINITLETLVVDVVNEGLINPKACYRITDSTQGIIRVWGKSATELTATAMLEGSDDGAGTVTNGQWGNYDVTTDVFTPVLGVEGNSQITSGAVYSQGDVSGLQSILTFAEDFALKSIDNATGNYSQALCNPSTFEMSSFAGATSKRIVISSSNGDKIAIQSDLAQIVKFAESSGEARIGFFTKFSVPIAQSSAIANATDAPSAITQLNLLLTAMRNYGLIAE